MSNGENNKLHQDGYSDHYWLCDGSCPQCGGDDAFDQLRDRRLEEGLPAKPGYYTDWSYSR